MPGFLFFYLFIFPSPPLCYVRIELNDVVCMYVGLLAPVCVVELLFRFVCFICVHPVPLIAFFLRPFNQEGIPQVGNAGVPLVFILFYVLQTT